MKRYLFILAVLMAQVAFGQIGSKKDIILAYEKANGSIWKVTEGNRLYALNKNVNIYYYFKNGICSNIVKIVSHGEIGTLKLFLEQNGYKYDTINSVYRKDNLVGEFDYQNQMVYLKIGEDNTMAMNTTK